MLRRAAVVVLERAELAESTRAELQQIAEQREDAARAETEVHT